MPFTSQGAYFVLFGFNRVVDCGYSIDILINFNLAFENSMGVLITSHYLIAKRYLQSFFVIDTLTVIPWQEVVASSLPAGSARGSRLLRLVRLFKLLRLVRAGRVFRHLKAEMGMLSSTWRYGETFALCLILLHWSACAYMLLAVLEEVDDPHRYTWRMGYIDSTVDTVDGKTFHTAEGIEKSFSADAVPWYTLCLSFGLCVFGGWGFDSPVQPITTAETTFTVVMAALFTVYYAYVSAVIVDCVKQTNITKSVIDGMFGE
jgi:hypothetical protein